MVEPVEALLEAVGTLERGLAATRLDMQQLRSTATGGQLRRAIDRIAGRKTATLLEDWRDATRDHKDAVRQVRAVAGLEGKARQTALRQLRRAADRNSGLQTSMLLGGWRDATRDHKDAVRQVRAVAGLENKARQTALRLLRRQMASDGLGQALASWQAGAQCETAHSGLRQCENKAQGLGEDANDSPSREVLANTHNDNNSLLLSGMRWLAEEEDGAASPHSKRELLQQLQQRNAELGQAQLKIMEGTEDRAASPHSKRELVQQLQQRNEHLVQQLQERNKELEQAQFRLLGQNTTETRLASETNGSDAQPEVAAAKSKLEIECPSHLRPLEPPKETASWASEKAALVSRCKALERELDSVKTAKAELTESVEEQDEAASMHSKQELRRQLQERNIELSQTQFALIEAKERQARLLDQVRERNQDLEQAQILLLQLQDLAVSPDPDHRATVLEEMRREGSHKFAHKLARELETQSELAGTLQQRVAVLEKELALNNPRRSRSASVVQVSVTPPATYRPRARSFPSLQPAVQSSGGAEAEEPELMAFLREREREWDDDRLSTPLTKRELMAGLKARNMDLQNAQMKLLQNADMSEGSPRSTRRMACELIEVRQKLRAVEREARTQAYREAAYVRHLLELQRVLGKEPVTVVGAQAEDAEPDEDGDPAYARARQMHTKQELLNKIKQLNEALCESQMANLRRCLPQERVDELELELRDTSELLEQLQERVIALEQELALKERALRHAQEEA